MCGNKLLISVENRTMDKVPGRIIITLLTDFCLYDGAGVKAELLFFLIFPAVYLEKKFLLFLEK